jgi:hypothetical protein
MGVGNYINVGSIFISSQEGYKGVVHQSEED